MDVIGFLCVSLGNSTVRLHDSLTADAHAHVQKLVSVVEMATVLQEYTSEEQGSVVFFFLWEKGLKAKDIHKETFPVYGGQCFSRNALQPWWHTFR
jgi:hypothetical protein